MPKSQCQILKLVFNIKYLILNIFNFRLKIIALTTLFFLLLFPYSVFAQNNSSAGPGSVINNLKEAGNAAKYDTNKGTIGDYVDLTGQIIGVFFAVVGIILIILIIHAGYLWMTAQGNEDNVTKAKTQIQNAVIGFIILISAYAVTYFVLEAMKGFSTAL